MVDVPEKLRSWATKGTALTALALCGSVAGMGAGIHALAGDHLPAAAAFLGSGTLMAGQLLLAGAAKAKGWVKLGGLSIYPLVMGTAIFLNVAGVADLTSSERAAQKAFETATSEIRPQIQTVAANYSATATEVSALADRSAKLAETERSIGGTCGGSPPGDGPIRKKRDADATELKAIATAFRTKASDVQGAMRSANTAISGYKTAEHAKVTQTVNDGLETAIETARLGALGGLDSRIRNLADQNDRSAVCKDPVLAAGLHVLLTRTAPAVPTAPRLPDKPSHEAVIRGLADHLGRVMTGKEAFDVELYGIPLVLGPLPELALILGLAWRAQERRDRLGPVGLAAAQMGLKAQGLGAAEALQHAARRGADNPLLRELDSYVVRDVSPIDHVVYARVPDDEASKPAIALMHSLSADGGPLKYTGFGPAGAAGATVVPEPADAAAPAHFFRFRRGRYEDMQREAVRAAIADDVGPDRPFRAAAE